VILQESIVHSPEARDVSPGVDRLEASLVRLSVLLVATVNVTVIAIAANVADCYQLLRDVPDGRYIFISSYTR
jgi:hypothetical protein